MSISTDDIWKVQPRIWHHVWIRSISVSIELGPNVYHEPWFDPDSMEVFSDQLRNRVDLWHLTMIVHPNLDVCNGRYPVGTLNEHPVVSP